MSSRASRPRTASTRSRRQRIAAGAVLATTGLLGTYMAALRPQPTYASPGSGGSSNEGRMATQGSAFWVGPQNVGSCDVTVTDDTGLRAAMVASVDDSVICIQGTITLVADLPTLDDSTVTLVGDDSATSIIDGGGSYRIISAEFDGVDDDTLTIMDLALVDGNVYDTVSGFGGAAVLLRGYGATDTLVMSGVRVEDNSALRTDPSITRGGAIAVIDGAAQIYDSLFGSNDGERGGALYVAEDLSIFGSTFTGNTATDDGGAIYFEGDGYVVGSTFTSNTADGTGGAIDFDATEAVVIDSTFTSNSAGSEGGAIFADESLTITDSTFTANTSPNGVGGGIAVRPNYTLEVEISGSTFTSNIARDSGGAVFWYSSASDLHVSSSTFTSNVATTGDGAAVYGKDYIFSMPPRSNIFIDASTFIGNTALAGDGGGIGGQAVGVHLENTFLGGNSAAGRGGAVSVDDTALVSLNFATLYDDTAGALGGGAAIYVGDHSLLSGTGSAVGNSTGDSAIELAGDAALDDTYVIVTGAGVPLTGPGSQRVAAGSLGLGALDGSHPGQAGRSPADTSVLVTGAPTSDLGTGVTQDQLGVARGQGSPAIWTIGARQVQPTPPPPPPPPVFPPSAPRDVSGVAGDRQVVVSWLPPASQGSFPVTNYRVTAAPGGQGCLVAAPTLTCAVTGLTNGTAYTFSVAALNGAGWGPSGVSGPVTPTPSPGPTPAPPPQDLPNPLGPGESLLLTDGVPDPNVVVEPNAGDNGLQIIGDDWAMDLDGLDPFGNPLNLGPDGVLILNQQRDVQTSGRGFLGDSDVDLYVFVNQPPTGAGTSADRLARVASAGDPVYVGTVRTTQAGTFAAQLRLPASIPPGVHTLQAVGWSPQRTTRAMNLGVLVAPWIVLDQGTRSADGRHDRIRTGGSTGGIDPGVRLTPWIRYAGQGAFKEGQATILVQGDGSFTWTRQIRKDKRLVAYVSYTPTDSNRVVWLRVR